MVKQQTGRKLQHFSNNRTAIQCKQHQIAIYVLEFPNKQREKVNVDRISGSLVNCFNDDDYGTKWNFIQQNYYPLMKPQQSQLKHFQINSMYFTVPRNMQKIRINTLCYTQISQSTFVFTAQNRFNQEKNWTTQLSISMYKPGLTVMDPIWLQFYKMTITEEYVTQLFENEKIINKLLQLQKL
ncbi:Hypothetical_protein [Hexamita inflata]|uniref:Hypothetical_protein n=1 Tax=Hexamita inflata TaxID=28002 RepID=A0ABP1IL53_9EUKA